MSGFLSRRGARALLPWYLSGTLTSAERQGVEAWLQADAQAAAELAAWSRLQEAVQSQPAAALPPDAWARLGTRLRAAPAAPRMRVLPAMAGALLLALVAWALLWALLRPGVRLAWSSSGGPVSGFQIYRASLQAGEMRLVGQVPAQPGARQYAFVDAALWPAGNYAYRVEVLGGTGQPIASQAIHVRGRDALPGQAAVAVAGLILAAGAVALLLGRQGLAWKSVAW
jgi:hypothetical protein